MHAVFDEAGLLCRVGHVVVGDHAILYELMVHLWYNVRIYVNYDEQLTA